MEAAIEAVGAERPGGRRVDVRRADETMCIVAKRPAPKPRPVRDGGPWVETRSLSRAPREAPREAQVIRQDRNERFSTRLTLR